MALPTVALVGSSGHLGQAVSAALVSPTFRESFSKVIFLKRKSTTDSNSNGVTVAEIRFFEEDDLPTALQGIDVLISTVGPSGHDFKDKLIDALAQSDVKLYIPSEFGVDHTVHDFPHAEWDRKKAHYEKAKATLTRTKICRIYIGLFMEDSVGPWFGFDTKKYVFESIGSHDRTVSFTSLRDVGNVAAQVSRMPIDDVPDQLHISGDALTIEELATTMVHVNQRYIQIKEVDLETYKQETVAEGTSDPSKYLRFLMGEGKINHTVSGQGNDNELVNPGERNWKWKTMEEYAEETGGMPWSDFEWNADSVN
jgi:hypothetical protein